MQRLKNLTLYCIIGIVLPCSTTSSAGEKVSTFITDLIKVNFRQCNIILAYDDESANNFENVRERMAAELARLDKEFYLVGLRETPVRLSRYSDILRRGSHCYFNIISLFGVSIEEGVALFSKLITWRYGAPTWKDMDRYVFLTRKTNVDALLLSDPVLKVKYRFAVGLSEQSSEFGLKTSCFYCNNGKPGLVEMSHLSQESSGMSLGALSLYPDFVDNFNGFKVRAAVSSKIVYRIEIYPTPEGTWEGKQGPHTQLIQLCQRKMNFTFELFPSIGGGGSGVKWPNGTWTGSMADVLYKNADFGMVTAQTLQRDELVSFSFPITYDWLTFATGQPKQIHTWKKVFWPFSPPFWLSLIPGVSVVFVALCVLPRAIAKFGWLSERRRSDVWFIVATILEQDTKLPRHPTLRSFASFWLLFALVITTAYRSQLVPSLAFPYVEKPPETFEQLTTSSYKWGLYYLAGAAYAAFRSSTNPTYVKIFQGMELEHSSVNCLVRAVETRFGCIIYEGSAIDVMHRSLSNHGGKPPILVAPTTTFFISSCWVMEKRAVFGPNFQKIMHLTVDMGLNSHWVAMNYARLRKERLEKAKNGTRASNDIRYDNSDGPKSLIVLEFTGPLYLFAAGVLIAAVAFFTELLLSRNPELIATLGSELKEKRKSLCYGRVPIDEGYPDPVTLDRPSHQV